MGIFLIPSTSEILQLTKSSKKLLKGVIIALGAFVAIAAIYFFTVYKFLFTASFTRKILDEKSYEKFFSIKQSDGNFEFHEDWLLRNKEDTEWFLAQNPQLIQINSFDGLKLVAYNLPKENALGTIILMHGYHSEPFREYACLARYYYNLGYNVFLPYQRTHGNLDGVHSEGEFITFGVKERYDLRDWILKANEIYGETNPLFLQGISMGCATTLMTLGFDLPSNIHGVIADCGFTTPYEIIWKVLTEDKKIPTAKLIIQIGNFLTNKIAGFDMNEYSTYEALAKNRSRENQIPILFIHGNKDEYVPFEMSKKNFGSCLVSFTNIAEGAVVPIPNPQADKYSFYEVQNSPHAIENFIDREQYEKRVADFLDSHLN